MSILATAGLRIADFDRLLKTDFQQIENILADGILAAYLLGFDVSQTEVQASIKSAKTPQNSSFIQYLNISIISTFADGDDEKPVKQIGDDDLNLQLRFDVSPKEAIDYFRRKRVVTKKEFNKLEREAKAASFTVQGIYRSDVLEAFKTEISNALDSGQTQKFVVDRFKKILDGAGHKMLGDFHLESIFRTNMQMAYGVGRRKAMEESAEYLPYWQYSAVGDDRTRPSHLALDGLVFPANHPFWDTKFPPWEINCRCSTFSVADYPPGYNHAQPNADATIIYDDEGLPAKAEYLTQVIDLKATKFVGVPKSANLETALKENARLAIENRKRK